VLAFADGDMDDLAGDVRCNQNLLGADIGIVGRDVAAAGEIDAEADHRRQRRDAHQQKHPQTASPEARKQSGPLRTVGLRFGRSFGFRRRYDFQCFITHDLSVGGLLLICIVGDDGAEIVFHRPKFLEHPLD
jgi:hypothetical protein